jgi:DNA topoisomerase-1
VPEETPPADLSLERAIELVEARAKGPASLGTDPETGLPIYVMSGRFGPYVQLGETPEKGSTEKPRRASLTRDDSELSLTLERAVELLSLPRLVGHDPEHDEDIVANFGRFGPYVKRGSDFRSLASDADVFAVTLEEAVELFRQEKPTRRGATRKVLRDLGPHPESGLELRLLEGRYGPYVSDGTTNASLPKDVAAEDLTLERAIGLLREREGVKPAGRSRAGGSKRSATRRGATRASAGRRRKA